MSHFPLIRSKKRMFSQSAAAQASQENTDLMLARDWHKKLKLTSVEYPADEESTFNNGHIFNNGLILSNNDSIFEESKQYPTQKRPDFS